MTTAPSLIAELDVALCSASKSRHLAMLRSVTELFLIGSEAFAADHVAIFDDVIGRLIEKTDIAALIELGARLAPLGNAPVNVMAALAGCDDITVSGPVLETSNVLSDQTLAEIAEKKSQKHLAKIVARPRLGEVVTDWLIDRGSPEIARKVADNRSARISELGFVKLIGRAKADKPLAAAIAERKDMPPELAPFLKLALG